MARSGSGAVLSDVVVTVSYDVDTIIHDCIHFSKSSHFSAE